MNPDHYVTITLRAATIQRYLDQAKSEGRVPVSINEIATTVWAIMVEWCEEHCTGQYFDGTSYFWFENPVDTMMFKLTHI